MALEDAIIGLIRALDRQQNNDAVAEIIRQRDEAIEMRRRTQANCDWADERRNKHLRELETECRRTRALRSVIKRMKASK